MPTSLPSQPTPPGKRSLDFRRLISRAEALTVLGMLLVVFSVFLTWQRVRVETTPLPTAFSAPLMDVVRTGRGILPTPRFWALWGCAMLCPLLLVWTPTPKNRLPLAIAQGVCGVVCVTIALLQFAMQPGVLVAIIGSALLIYGAIDRYEHPVKLPPKQKKD